MSKRSKLDKINILNCIDRILIDLKIVNDKAQYAIDDMIMLKKYIDKKDWILRTPCKNKRSSDEVTK